MRKFRWQYGNRAGTNEASVKLVRLLGLLVLLAVVSRAEGWRLAHHDLMAEDALKAIRDRLPQDVSIENIKDHADRPDKTVPHPLLSCHRVRSYQDTFQVYGGRKCEHVGAERWAAVYLQKARDAFLEGNLEDAEGNLGYAIHYIQDAVCLSHVFPFAEGIPGVDAHGGFEGYAEEKYKDAQDWRKRVSEVQATEIFGIEDLATKVDSIADQVFQFPVQFLAPNKNYYGYFNGARISGPHHWPFLARNLPLGVKPWQVEDQYIIRAMEIAASVVKGAAIWVFSEENRAPNQPATPSGPLSGVPGVAYNFSSSATDPDGDRVAIRFDWSDGTISDWSSFVPSGETVTMAHSWSKAGTYNVKAQARDTKSASSSWSVFTFVIGSVQPDEPYSDLKEWLFGDTKNITLTAGWNIQGKAWEGLLEGSRHTGIDFAAAEGTPVYSATDGIVINVVHGRDGNDLKDLSTVAVYHEATGTTFIYLHMKDIKVSQNQEIKAGGQIGTVGSRGPGGVHLHFEARPGKRTLAARDVNHTINPYEAARKAREKSWKEYRVGALCVSIPSHWNVITKEDCLRSVLPHLEFHTRNVVDAIAAYSLTDNGFPMLQLGVMDAPEGYERDLTIVHEGTDGGRIEDPGTSSGKRYFVHAGRLIDSFKTEIAGRPVRVCILKIGPDGSPGQQTNYCFVLIEGGQYYFFTLLMDSGTPVQKTIFKELVSRIHFLP